MTRKEFIKKGVVFGIGIPLMPIMLDSCSSTSFIKTQFETDFNGKVLIIGAGAAGLIAGYLLSKSNIDFQIIEATSKFGGRVKRNNSFADFPIDLGAEWIHTNPNILGELIDNELATKEIEFIDYRPKSVYIFKDKKLRKRRWVSNFYKEYKFQNTSWYGYFEKYILPEIKDNITYNSPVQEINYEGDSVLVKNNEGRIFSANKVLLTTSIKILQKEEITFIPKMPDDKINAINSIVMPDGLKVFIKFSEKFYPDMLFTGSLLKEISSSDKLFYDAAFKKESKQNILGFFCVGEKASPYTSLKSEEKIIRKVLKELDIMFSGKASQTYVNHIIQNWSKEKYIGGSYSMEFSENRRDTIDKLKMPIKDRIFFAGEALSLKNGSTVHGAGESGYSAVKLILKNENGS